MTLAPLAGSRAEAAKRTLTPLPTGGIFVPMSIAATVENGTIKLPEGIHLPDGTRVEIVLPQEETDPANALGWMAEFVGCIDGLPEDFAAEHDHYIHGTPKRAGR